MMSELVCSRNCIHEQDVCKYVCNGEKIKELFASILNEIPISVRCVSAMIVVFNA